MSNIVTSLASRSNEDRTTSPSQGHSRRDDYTPITVLKAEFRMSDDQAYRIMMTAHRRGVCVVAVFAKDIAETKATRATEVGRSKGYPLTFTTEPEE